MRAPTYGMIHRAGRPPHKPAAFYRSIGLWCTQRASADVPWDMTEAASREGKERHRRGAPTA